MKMMTRLIAFFLLFGAFSASAAEPLSRWSRFVCEDGLSLFNKQYVISFYRTKDFGKAMEKLERVRDIHESILRDEGQAFFSKFKIGIVEDHKNKVFHVVDQICYSNRPVSGVASVNAFYFKEKFNFDTKVMKAHTSRLSSSSNQQRDYLELVFDGIYFEF